MIDKDKTMFVKYKNPDGTHKKEAERPYIIKS